MMMAELAMVCRWGSCARWSKLSETGRVSAILARLMKLGCSCCCSTVKPSLLWGRKLKQKGPEKEWLAFTDFSTSALAKCHHATKWFQTLNPKPHTETSSGESELRECKPLKLDAQVIPHSPKLNLILNPLNPKP